MVSSGVSLFCFLDERDRFGHLEDSPDFDQRALEVRFGRAPE
jgi:hypothetical protein